VYNINFDAIEVDNKTYPDNEVYVDPETGRTVRVDTGRTVPDGEVAPEGFSISEFTGYDEHDELDFGDIPNIGSPV